VEPCFLGTLQLSCTNKPRKRSVDGFNDLLLK
jgi:hypothetical protein